MRYKDEQCPQCGNYVRGQFKISSDREFFTKGGKSLALAGVDFLAPGLGTGIDLLLGGKIDKTIDDFADDIDSSDEYIFECPKCGHCWQSGGRPPMPEEIIIQVRDAYVQELKKKRPYISTVIFAFLTLYCLVCMFIGVSEDNGFQIFGSFIFAIPFLIPTILKWRKISSLNQQIQECEMRSLRDFKNTHKDLFREYSQYN